MAVPEPGQRVHGRIVEHSMGNGLRFAGLPMNQVPVETKPEAIAQMNLGAYAFRVESASSERILLACCGELTTEEAPLLSLIPPPRRILPPSEEVERMLAERAPSKEHIERADAEFKKLLDSLRTLPHTTDSSDEDGLKGKENH